MLDGYSHDQIRLLLKILRERTAVMETDGGMAHGEALRASVYVTFQVRLAADADDAVLEDLLDPHCSVSRCQLLLAQYAAVPGHA